MRVLVLFGVVLALVSAASTTYAFAGATNRTIVRSASDPTELKTRDVKATVGQSGGAAMVGRTFFVLAGGEYADAQSASGAWGYSLRLEIPAGLTIVRLREAGHGGAAPCQQDAAGVTCAGIAALANYSVAFHLELRASRAGVYSLRNTVTLTDGIDPNATNNVAELSVTVADAPLAVAGLIRSPTVPRAGRVFRATLRLTRGGTPVMADRTACRLSIGGRVIHARAMNVPTGSRCTWLVPAWAKGQQYRGSVGATADGKSFARRFAGRVA